MDMGLIITLISEIVALIGIIVPIIVSVGKISNGTKCQLRSEMLHIYYRHREDKIIRQYEYENFVMLYEAYKALKGNSFKHKIYSELKSWDVVS